MAGCNTGRNIQKYKGAGASTLQDALENSNVATLDINLISGAVYIGDGGGLSNINASAVAGNLQAVTDNSATTTNKITLTNGVTSLETTGNVLITGNVTAGNFLGDGGTLSNIAASKDFQEVTDLGATSSNKITLTNSVTSLETSGNIELGHASDTTIARSGPGKVTIEGDEIRTGTVPISKGGTGTTSASAAATALGLGTGDSPRFTAIELGNASDTTLARSGPGKITIEGQEIRTGTVPVSKGGTGTTSLNNLITMGTHTTGDFVGTITGGNGITSSGGTTGEDTDHTLSIDTKTNGGLVFENNKLAVNLGASTITGTLAVSDGGTGTTSLNNLITMGTHTTGNFVQTITGGNGISSTGATSGENVAHSLSVDTKANGGLVFENNKLAVKLDAGSITGKLAVSDGGTGYDTYTTGQLLVANGTSSLTKLTPGTSGHFLKSQGAGSALVWASVADIGSATPGELIMGDYLTGGPHTGEDDTTIHVDGTPTNTANTVVVRSLTGDIAVSGLTTTTIQLGHVSDTTLARLSAGVVTIEGQEIRTGTVPIAKGGTGATSLVDLITLGTHTTGNYVASINGGAGITAGGAAEGGTPSVSVDIKQSGGLVFESNKLAVKLDAGSINGTLPIAKGGTGVTSGITALNATNLTSGTVNILRGGTGVTSGITVLNATNLASGTVNILRGGTGVTSGLTALNAANLTSGTVNTLRGGTGISGGYSAGDILYATNSTTLSKLNKGGDGEVLTLASGLPTWAAATGSSGGSYWTEHTNGNDVYYNSGNVGISNAAPTHTLDIGSNVSVIDDGVDKLYIRGNVYSTNDIIALGTIHTDIIKAKDAFIKNTTVVAERPTRQVRLN